MVQVPLEYCFCIIKPDALERGFIGEIIARIERMGLRLFNFQMRWKTRNWCEQHYAHLDNEILLKLSEFMTSQPILGFTVHGPHAIERMRALAGPTKSWEAAPGTIRGDFGYSPVMYNCIHVSDSQESTEHELKLFMDVETDLHKGQNDASNVVQ